MTEETLKVANDLVDKIEGLKELDRVIRTYSSDKYLHVRFESLIPDDLKITINNRIKESIEEYYNSIQSEISRYKRHLEEL